MVDLKNLAPGDVVHVRGLVVTRAAHKARVQVGKNQDAYIVVIDDDEIVHVEPRPLKVGNWVKALGTGTTFEIRFIEDGWAYLRPTDGDRYRAVRLLTELERA